MKPPTSYLIKVDYAVMSLDRILLDNILSTTRALHVVLLLPFTSCQEFSKAPSDHTVWKFVMLAKTSFQSTFAFKELRWS